jgi:hypothetical protein
MIRNFLKVITLFILLLNLNCKESTNLPEDKIKKEEIPEIEVKAFVDKPEVSTFSYITYTLITKANPKIKIRIPEIGSVFIGLDIVDMGEDEPKKQEGRILYKKWYKLLANDIGSYIIPEVKIIYWDKEGNKKEIFTEKIFIEVKSSLKNNKNIKDILGIKSLEKIKFSQNMLLILSIIGVLFIVIVSCFFYFRHKRKKAVSEQQIPLHEIVKMELEKLKGAGLIEAGNFKEYYFRLSEILRHYLEKRFRFPAKERTSEELLKDIQKINDIRENYKFSLKDFLKRSDWVKFAKTNPLKNEIEKDSKLVEDIFNSTKPITIIKDASF